MWKIQLDISLIQLSVYDKAGFLLDEPSKYLNMDWIALLPIKWDNRKSTVQKIKQNK